MAQYAGKWRAASRLVYDQPTGPTRLPSKLHGVDTPETQEWQGQISAPDRQGAGSPGLVEDESSYAADYHRGWVVDRTPEDHDHGTVAGGGQSLRRTQQLSMAAHDEHYGAVEHTTQEPPMLFQTDRRVLWRQETAQPLGHGSQAALGRGLNGLDMNNDPAAQHYGLRRQVQIERKFPGQRVWRRELTPFRPKFAEQAVVSRPVGSTVTTSWAPTLTMARTGKASPPAMRRTPRNWAEDRTTDYDPAATESETSWGL